MGYHTMQTTSAPPATHVQHRLHPHLQASIRPQSVMGHPGLLPSSARGRGRPAACLAAAASERDRVLVVGAGIAGLALAAGLTRVRHHSGPRRACALLAWPSCRGLWCCECRWASPAPSWRPPPSCGKQVLSPYVSCGCAATCSTTTVAWAEHRQPQNAGNAIGMWPNAFRALAALGVVDDVRQEHDLLRRSGLRWCCLS